MYFVVFQVDDKFWVIEQNGVRCFLFEGDEYSLLVDSAYEGDLRGVCRNLTGKPIKLLLTHGDRDHVGCAEQFDEIYAHPSEFVRISSREGGPVDLLPAWERDIFDLGIFRFETVLIPGHTPGCIALLETNRRFLLAGDCVQVGPIYMFGPGRNMEAFRVSLEKLNRLRPRYDTIYSSHNLLEVEPPVIDELEDFAGDICQSRFPVPELAPEKLPKNVRTFSKGRVSFYLELPEI